MEKQSLDSYSQVARNTHDVVRRLISAIAEVISDEQKFMEMLKRTDRAALTIYRLSSALERVVSLEGKIYNMWQNVDDGSKERNKNLTREECQMIISMVREWGLLSEGYNSEKIEAILSRYE